MTIFDLQLGGDQLPFCGIHGGLYMEQGAKDALAIWLKEAQDGESITITAKQLIDTLQ